jgi:hypothetical protein
MVPWPNTDASRLRRFTFEKSDEFLPNHIWCDGCADEAMDMQDSVKAVRNGSGGEIRVEPITANRGRCLKMSEQSDTARPNTLLDSRNRMADQCSTFAASSDDLARLRVEGIRFQVHGEAGQGESWE